MERIFAEGESAVLDARQSAVLRFAMKLSKCPAAATRQDVQALIEAGLSAEEILDLILSATLFAWANRLIPPWENL
jgi:uncharacterized peroxidase-related enzyme